MLLENQHSMIILIDLRDCKTVLEFLDRVVKALKVQPFYGTNLEVVGRTISSLENHGFTFPLTMKLINIRDYQEKCPRGWEVFMRSLLDAQEKYKNKSLHFSWKIEEGL